MVHLHEHKRYYYTFDNSLLFFEGIRHYTNLSTLNHNVRFFRVSTGRWHNAIRVCATLSLCASDLIIPGHSRKFPVETVDIVNPGIQ